MYERENELEVMNIREMNYVAAMAPPGGGRNPVDPRFISLFNVFNVVFPKESSLLRYEKHNRNSLHKECVTDLRE